MEKPIPQSKTRRKLSKAEIVDILERNVSLYREEESFAHYLIELAVYLLEYEYDWAESGATTPNLRPRPEEVPRQNHINERNGANIVSAIQPSARVDNRTQCPFCGTPVESGKLVCPSCKNMAK